MLTLNNFGRGITGMSDLNQTSNPFLNYNFNNYNTSSFPNSFGFGDIMNPLLTSNPISLSRNTSGLKNTLLGTGDSIGNENIFTNSNPNLKTNASTSTSNANENENGNTYTNGNSNSNMHLGGIIIPKKNQLKQKMKMFPKMQILKKKILI